MQILIDKLNGVYECKVYNHQTKDIKPILDALLTGDKVEIAHFGFISASIFNSMNSYFIDADVNVFGIDREIYPKTLIFREYPAFNSIISQRRIILTSSNLVPKNYFEITLVFDRDECLAMLIKNYIRSHRETNPFVVPL